MRPILTVTLSALMLSAPAFANTASDTQTAPEKVQYYTWTPVGNGDPNGISCHVSRGTPPRGPMVCLHNSDWKRINNSYLRGVPSF